MITEDDWRVFSTRRGSCSRGVVDDCATAAKEKVSSNTSSSLSPLFYSPLPESVAFTFVVSLSASFALFGHVTRALHSTKDARPDDDDGGSGGGERTPPSNRRGNEATAESSFVNLKSSSFSSVACNSRKEPSDKEPFLTHSSLPRADERQNAEARFATFGRPRTRGALVRSAGRDASLLF